MEPTPQQTTSTTINYDDFAKLDLRVATVLECKPHPNADKLLVLQIELTNGERRQIGLNASGHARRQWDFPHMNRISNI